MGIDDSEVAHVVMKGARQISVMKRSGEMLNPVGAGRRHLIDFGARGDRIASGSAGNHRRPLEGVRSRLGMLSVEAICVAAASPAGRSAWRIGAVKRAAAEAGLGSWRVKPNLGGVADNRLLAAR